jgi:hypothetical protein
MNSDNWLELMLADEQQRRQRLPAVKALLCEALKARRIATVSIEYDGEGDSGQVNDIQAFDRKRQPISLDQPVTLAIHKPEEPTTYDTLYEALDDFAWTILEIYHGGFVNNDGGFGTIAIDANTAKVTIDHNDRITDVDNTVTEL